ncbi:MAG: hypothetical protein IJP35_08140 [Clostridia bacterium]|nr:hypothetical protein [Clostridia bacterium]
MTNRKTTKRALISSLLALLICCTMLVGTTFAWFTDSEVLNDNKIQAGTLDLVLGENVVWEDDNTLWEPGFSKPISFTLTNAGSLWLKYTLVFDDVKYGENGDGTEFAPGTGDNGNADGSNITEVLDVYAGVYNGVASDGSSIINGTRLGTVHELLEGGKLNVEGILAAKGKSDNNYDDNDTINLVIKMQEEAGNEYQGDWCSFDIVANATQYTYENDGNNNDQYDAEATYPTVAAELVHAFEKGGIVAINDNVNLVTDSTAILAATDLTVDGTISAARNNASSAATYSTIVVNADTTISGAGTVSNTEGYGITLKKEGATLTINGGNYVGQCTAINVVTGTLEINGGYFEDTSDWNGQYLINMIDANYANGTASVIVKGGTFVNWNPAASSAETGAPNLVADGYVVVEETQANGDVWYTVVAD